MAIPKIKEQDIIDALRYIDENGVPFHNQSTKYTLVTEDGKGTTCIQKLKEQMTCNYGSTRAPLMKRMLCREMIFAL